MERRLLHRLQAVEQWLDRVVTGGLARTFPSPLDLVELESAIRAECDARTAPIPGGRVAAPNEYAIVIAPGDLAHSDDNQLMQRLVTVLDEHVATKGYALAGPLAVEIIRDENQPTGLPTLRTAILATGVREDVSGQFGLIIGTRRLGLAEGTLSIGRDDSMGLRLDDVGVSRHHCDISRRSDSLTIHDRQSTNGTIVNGRRVTKAELKHGDVIEIGSTLVIVDVKQ